MSCGGFFLVLSTFTAFRLRNQDECLSMPVWKSKFYGAFVLNHRVVLHAIDATPARWRGDAGSSVEQTRRNEDAIDAVVCVLRLVSSTNNIKSECTSRHR